MASLNKNAAATGRSSGTKSAKANKKPHPTKPQILVDAEAEHDVKKLLELFGYTGISADSAGYWSRLYHYGFGPQLGDGSYSTTVPTSFSRRLVIRSRKTTVSIVSAPGGVKERQITYPVAYVSPDGVVWASELTIFVRGELWGYYNTNSHGFERDNVTLSPYAQVTPFKISEKYLADIEPLQEDKELFDIIKGLNSYAYDFVRLHNVTPICYLMAPYLETLSKAGYAFVEQFFSQARTASHNGFSTDVDRLNRLCKRGNNPAEIFKTTKSVYKVLGPTETDMELWDTYRKLDKFGRISPDTLRQSYEHAMSVKDLDLINLILSQKYNGKPVFDWDSLYRYLCRLDKFEAIANTEALILIKDYLNMCRQLGMRPRTDGDSLKREHDVAARLCRNMRNEKLAAAMLPACERLSKYDYCEGVYFIRGIQSFDDLLSEATQQHSCLVSYGEDIAAGRSRIYVMREVSRPDKSLITVELSSDRRSITQALVAYNKHIRNKSQHEFLERWLRYVRDLDKYGAA